MKEGVTGFWSQKGGAEPPRLDFDQIKRDFHAIAREANSSVEEIQEAHYPRNHHRVLLQNKKGDRETILINEHHPIVAFAEYMSQSDLVANAQFKDHE